MYFFFESDCGYRTCHLYAANNADRIQVSVTAPSDVPTYLLTYLLTPWSRVLLEKLTSKLCR